MSAESKSGFWVQARRAALATGRAARAFGVWFAARSAALWRRAQGSARLRAAAAWTRARARTAAGALARAWDHGEPLARLARPLFAALRIAALAAVATGLVWASQALWVHEIPPGEIGVRQVVWGDSGIVERDYAPGFGFALAGRSRWHHVPSVTRAFVYAAAQHGGQHPMLAITTRDGEPLDVAVTVPYRVAPGRAWRLVADGYRQDYEALALSTLSRVLPQELSRLSALEWADPDARAAACRAALEVLRRELDPIHLEPEAILLGAVAFHSGFEKKMLEKQLQSQTRRTNESIAERARVALEFADKQRELASLEARLVAQRDLEIEALRIELEEGSLAAGRELAAYRSARTLEGDAQVEQAKLAGDLARAEAQAFGARLTRELTASAGGRLHLAVLAARNLRFGKVKLNSNDPRVPKLLDLDEMVDLLVGAGG